jgi:hypothetical protein
VDIYYKDAGSTVYKKRILSEVVSKRLDREIDTQTDNEVETLKAQVKVLQNTISHLLEKVYEDKLIDSKTLCDILGLSKLSIKRNKE